MLKRLIAGAIAAAVLALPAAGEPAATDQIGPIVGQTAPSLSSTTAVASEDVLEVQESQGVVLVFFRSAVWCPFCKNQLTELKTAAGPLADNGWRLAALSYDSPESLKTFALRNEINYTLLSDPDSVAIDAFGLRNRDVAPGSRADGIPHPAVVFVRNDGDVAAVLREEGYRTRPSPQSIIDTAILLNEAVGAEG
jgi:peroxiredoxin